MTSETALPSTTSARIPTRQPTSAVANRTLPGRFELPNGHETHCSGARDAVGYCPRRPTSSRSALPIPGLLRFMARPRTCTSCPLTTICAGRPRSEDSDTVQAVQHVVDSARRSLPAVGPRAVASGRRAVGHLPLTTIGPGDPQRSPQSRRSPTVPSCPLIPRRTARCL